MAKFKAGDRVRVIKEPLKNTHEIGWTGTVLGIEVEYKPFIIQVTIDEKYIPTALNRTFGYRPSEIKICNSEIIKTRLGVI